MATSSATAGVGFFEKLADFQVPSQAECVDHLAEAPLVATIPMVIFGVLYLLFGWRLHKPLVTANAIAAGAFIGGLLGELSGKDNPNVPLFGSIAGAVLLGVLAMLLIHGAVCAMGILAGAAMGFGVWVYISNIAGNPSLLRFPWAGALVGLVALGLLAYANFRLAVMIFTAFQGAVMLVVGTTALLLFSESAAGYIRQDAQTNVHLLAALVAVPAVVGLAVQHVVAATKARKKLKAG